MNTIATEESDGEWRHQACDAMQRPEEGDPIKLVESPAGPSISQDRRRARALVAFVWASLILYLAAMLAGEEAERS